MTLKVKVHNAENISKAAVISIIIFIKKFAHMDCISKRVRDRRLPNALTFFNLLFLLIYVGILVDILIYLSMG